MFEPRKRQFHSENKHFVVYIAGQVPGKTLFVYIQFRSLKNVCKRPPEIGMCAVFGDKLDANELTYSVLALMYRSGSFDEPRMQNGGTPFLARGCNVSHEMRNIEILASLFSVHNFHNFRIAHFGLSFISIHYFSEAEFFF